VVRVRWIRRARTPLGTDARSLGGDLGKGKSGARDAKHRAFRVRRIERSARRWETRVELLFRGASGENLVSGGTRPAHDGDSYCTGAIGSGGDAQAVNGVIMQNA